MAMNPRLLRPRQTIHPEAADWANRVRTNGGSVSGTTLSAVNRFVKAIHAAGIRDRFYRLNLFCGNSDGELAAVRTPLFRGPSLTGTQFGNTIDTNFNFVSGDYSESSGLLGNGSSKRLGTGLLRNAMTVSLHMGVFVHTRNTVPGNYIRAQAEAASGHICSIQTFTSAGNVIAINNSATANGNTPTTQSYASQDFLLSCCAGTGASDLRLIINGTQAGTGQGRDSSALAAQFTILARQNLDTGAWSEHGNGRIGGYTIGSNLTNAEAATYSTIWDTFLRAMGRR